MHPPTAFQVACSDGEIEPEEDQQLRSLAQVPGIGAGVLELEIERFQRLRMRTAGPADPVAAC